MGVAKFILSFSDVLSTTYYSETVSVLQNEVWCGQQVEAHASHATHVETIAFVEAQRAEFAAVGRTLCNDDLLRDELSVEMIPIDILSIPILALVLQAKEHGELRDILFLRDDHQAVVGLKARIAYRTECRVGITPDA